MKARLPKLTLHCGAHEVDWEQVEATPCPPATDTHFPIPHHIFVSSVTDALERQGLEFIAAGHSLNNGGAEYFGIGAVRAKGGDLEQPNWETILGLRNAHNKKFTAELAVGSHVFVCDNLAFSGEIHEKRKHTRNIAADLDNLIHRSVGKLGGMMKSQEERILSYRATDISDAMADHLIVEMFRGKVINTQRIPAVLKNWEEPPHAEFEERNLWSLFNAATEALKGRLPDVRGSMALHGICDAAVHAAAI